MNRTIPPVVLLSLLAACVVTTPPIVTPPPVPTAPAITFDIVAVRDDTGAPIPGAFVRVNTHLRDGDDHDQTTNADGFTLFTIPDATGDASIFITARGYQPYDSGTVHPRDLVGRHNIIRLTADAPILTNAGERGRVRVDGIRFVREDGSIFQWLGCSDFLAFKRFRDHEDLGALLTERIAVGCNTLRVLGMVDSFAKLRPDGDGYYRDLGAFADLLAGRGLRFEFVVFADAQIIVTNPGEQAAHLARVVAMLAQKPNVFIEIANEPFKNLPGEGARAFELGRAAQGRGVPIASGDYDIPDGAATFAHLDYVTIHTERKPEWPRTGKDSLDVRDGFGWADGSVFAGVRVPVVSDEPMGFAEVERPGSRSTSVDDASAFAATCALMGSGCTYHSDAGITSTPFGPVQRRAAEAFFDAMRWVPVEAQFAPYQRGSADGGPGVGQMPLEHRDVTALRTFCKRVGGAEYCVAVRPEAAWTAQARDGWRVAGEPRRGLVRLER